MKKSLLKLPHSFDYRNLNNNSFCVGHIVEINEHLQALIDYKGNPLGAIKARSVVQFPNSEKLLRVKVLLIFENEDPTLPVIVGLIHEKIINSDKVKFLNASESKTNDMVLKGKGIAMEADQEIVFRCGQSSITIRNDGKVIIKGKNLVSRASANNKIKGANVNIN